MKFASRWMVVFALVALFASAGFALAPSPALAATGASPCAQLTLSASPKIVGLGGTETISTSVTNCSNMTETLTLRYRISGPCSFRYSYHANVTVLPGQTLSASKSFVVPSNACQGTYKIVGRAFLGSTLLATAHTSFFVQIVTGR